MTTFKRASSPPPQRTFRRAGAEFKFFGHDVPRDDNGRWTRGGGAGPHFADPHMGSNADIKAESNLRDRKLAALDDLEQQISKIRSKGALTAEDEALVKSLQSQHDSLERVARMSLKRKR